MSKIIADRVLETSTTIGSGDYSLAGAIVGYRAFSTVCVNADTFTYYAEAVDASGAPSGDWETGLGIWNTGNTITRSIVYASSNSNAAVVWEAGTKRIALSAVAALGLAATGAPGNHVFIENDTNVTGSYSITPGKNALSAGPITIDDGVVVTIPDGSVWTIV